MKLKSILAIGLCALFLASCSAGFILDGKALKGATITYITGGNGMDYTTYTMNADGTGGTFESGSYSYDFPDEAAANDGGYDEKEWFLTSGQRGSFTYDADTYIASITATAMFEHKDVATYFEADYEWMDIVTWAKAVFGDTVTAATQTMDVTVVLTADFDMPSMALYVKDGDNWHSVFNQAMSITDSGTTRTMSSDKTVEFTVSGTSIVKTTTSTYRSQVGTGTQSVSTEIETITDTVRKFFIVGEETGDKTFDKIWKEGNGVTFWTTRLEEEYLGYDGDTAPTTAPAVDPNTGNGVSSGADWYWSIDRDVADIEIAVTFTHYGDFILANQQYLAGRGLEF